MKQMIYIGLVITLFSVIAFSIFRDQIKTNHALDFVTSSGQIRKASATIINAPGLTEKKQIDIINNVPLDSLTILLKKSTNRINVQRAKLNDVFIILELFKGQDSIQIKVYNSKYTGWILQIGNDNFDNKYFFQWIEEYVVKG